MDVTKICEAVIVLIVAIITTFVIPWLKQHISSATLEEVEKWVKIAVQAAEMIYTGSGMGETKKEYVEKFLREQGITIDADKLNNLIESAVLELKKGLE